jgi:hypothetical protein
VGPWDPNWRPDPTGRRLVAIRAARRGALLAAVIFGGLVLVAALVAPPLASATPGVELAAGVVIAVASLPALALLGAGLTSAALGSRSSAASAGLAMAVGAPVAAVTSAMICTFVLVGTTVLLERAPVHVDGVDAAGRVLRVGVSAAVRIAPLIALGSVGWVVFLRRLGPRG